MLLSNNYFLRKAFCVPVFLLFAASLYALSTSPANASEIDSVTTRHVPLANSRAAIDRIVNQRLREGVARANERRGSIENLDSDEYCDEDDLYDELRRAIFQSFTVAWGLKGYSLDTQFRELLAQKSYHLSLNDSIYRDIDYLEGFSLNLKELSDVVRIDGHLVGIDKLGHFFAEGYRYLEIVSDDADDADYDADAALRSALQWGREKEEGLFGYTTTGIFSYGDLVANFNGYRFWNRVLLKQADPLATGLLQRLFERPYVSCNIKVVDSIRYRKIVRSWELVRGFDISQYVDGVWDEGNNCNSYADPVIEEKVMHRVKEVDSSFACPVAPDECVAGQQRYSDFAGYLLQPRCLTARPSMDSPNVVRPADAP